MEYKNITIAPGRTRHSAIRKAGQNSAEGGWKGGKADPDWSQTLHLSPEEDASSSDLTAVMRPRDGSKYRYIKTIGRGGMKVVLEVYDHDTMRHVAMALLPDVSTRSKLEQGQFLREARITAGLEHPNIVPVHDIGLDSSGSPYFTMKLLRGRTLAVVLKKLAENDPEYVKRYPFDSLMRIYTRICNAIAFAHSQGVLHLDLKPENVQIGDFGEVLVLDWGLARKIAPLRQPERKINTKTRKMKRLSPAGESQVNGTPGYMAPEQIRGARHSCSPQTDIYSLGAILYAMITYQNPLQQGPVEQMLHDTLRGNIIRPSSRVEDREIPYGIEAVVMKAMSLNPADRYSGVKELRDEVIHFVGGFATEAEKAGPLKKMLLFMRRHRRSLISGAVILTLTLMLGIFSWREAHRTISLWIPALTADFQKPDFPMDACSFRDLNFKEKEPAWKLTESQGVCPEPRQWLVFREPFQENIRITLTLGLQKGAMNELEIALIPAVSTGETLSRKSPLLSCHLLGAPHHLAEILDGRNFSAPGIVTSVPLPAFRKNKVSVTVEHENGVFSLFIDRKTVLKVPSYRLFGNGPVYVAVRADISRSCIRNLEICRLAPPENATSLLAGDTLLEEHLYEQAIRRYLLVDDNRPGSKLAEKALQKAYLAAFKLESLELRNEFILDIKKRLAAKYPNFNMSQLLIADACAAWRNKDYALAIQLMNRAFEYDPGTRVVAYVLGLPHEPLPEETQHSLIRLIRRTHGLTSLDLSNYGLSSLHGIAGMPLISLNCSNNRLTSLRDLEGMPLESLDCSGNRIDSLHGVSRMPLRYLDCSNNRIRDFSPLKKLRLRRLNRTGNPGKPVRGNAQ